MGQQYTVFTTDTDDINLVKFQYIEVTALALTFLTGLALFFMTIGVNAPLPKMKAWVIMTLSKVPLLVCLTRIPEVFVRNITMGYEDPFRQVLYGDLIIGVRIFKCIVIILLFSLSVVARFNREDVHNYFRPERKV
mgnify:CR=1 FL=1